MAETLSNRLSVSAFSIYFVLIARCEKMLKIHPEKAVIFPKIVVS